VGRDALRENATLAALSGPAGTMSLLIPLYLSYLGYQVGIIGGVLAFSSVATLLARVLVPKLYKPERSRLLLIATLIGGAVTFAVMPWMPGLPLFMVMLVINRILFGLATTFFLARYLDAMGASTDRRKAMGYYGGTQAVGYTSSNAIVGVVADFLGYPAAFLYGTVFSMLAVILLLISPELAPKLASRRGEGAPKVQGGIRGWLHSASDPGLWSVINVGSWNNLFHIVLVSFFPVFAAQIGLGPAQVGLTRSLYSGLNAVGRPLGGIVMGRASLKTVIRIGLSVQAVLLFTLPFMHEFLTILPIFLLIGATRSVVVVANSIQLVEEVDETRVSRGLATSAYSTTGDVSNIAAPALAGTIASLVGVGGMFSLMAGVAFSGFLAGDYTIQRWRKRLQSEPSGAAGAPILTPRGEADTV
jgi:predicted MFS family arabinose efflux permease